MSRPAPVPSIAILPTLPGNWRYEHHALLGDGGLAILGSSPSEPGVRLWSFDGRSLMDGPNLQFGPRFPIVARFADGRWLLADARTRGEPNASIVASDGGEISRTMIGDGIEHLKIDDAGRIWVGWFDEGVFGNEAWSVPGHKWPPSAHGLAAFDEHGELCASAEGGPRGSIVDCYALNVVGETAWACTYTDFPILQLSVGQPSRWWTTELSGVRALAVQPPYVLAAGGYKDDANRAVLLRLREDDTDMLGEWRLPFSSEPGEHINFLDARADVLSIIQHGQWKRWRVADFVAAA